jgi:hypothetical protein
MKHYTSRDWADLARNAVGTELKTAMRSHLAGGCAKCAQELGLWQRVYETARRQISIQPPDSLVRTVKGLYSIHGFRRRKSDKATIARLLFDSFQAPALAGVRSASAFAPRQLLYEAGHHRIDIWYEPRAGSEKINLVGQILDLSNPGNALNALPVALLKGRQIVCESQTNVFGAFHLECNQQSGLKLRVSKLPGVAEAFIPLAKPDAHAPAGTTYLADTEGVRHIPNKAPKRNSRKRQRKPPSK